MFIEVEFVAPKSGIRSFRNINVKTIKSQKLVMEDFPYTDTYGRKQIFTQPLTRITFKDGKTMLVTNSPASIIKHRIPYL